MAISPQTLRYLVTPSDWLDFIGDDAISVEDAIEACEVCWKNASARELDINIVPLLWKRFDDERWYIHITQMVKNHINETLNSAGGGDTLTLVNRYVKTARLCKSYLQIDKMTDDFTTKGFLTRLLTVADKKEPVDKVSHWYRLGAPHLLNKQEIVDSVMQVEDWEHLVTLPIKSLDLVFSAVAEDSRFTPGSENDLKLSFSVGSFLVESKVESLFLGPSQRAVESANTHSTISTLMERAKENRYWLAFVLNFYSETFYGRWGMSVESLLDDFREERMEWLTTELIQNMLLSMEDSNHYSVWTPKNIQHFLGGNDTSPFKKTDDVWSELVPQWSEHVETWKALGMERKEMVYQCIELLNSVNASRMAALPSDINFSS